MPRWNPCEGDVPFMGALSEKAARDNFPLSGMVSLTARCNLSCVHCYIKDSSQELQPECDTETFKRIFDEITDIGTLFLTITGGEPLVRSDFKELYSYARKCGLMLTLFSNATLVDNEIIALLKDMPPRYVDISIYGATKETYESITGVKGSFQRCLDGIELLLNNDIKVNLKSVLMKPNIAEFTELKKMAAHYDVPFRIDSMVFSKFSGDKSPLDLRIAVESGVACEAQMDGFVDSLKKNFDGSVLNSDKLYSCGAGRSTFHVTENGMLQPCLMVTDIEADLKKYSFREAWAEVSHKTSSLKVAPDDKCNSCDLYAICGYCPPMGKYSSSGSGDEKDYFCEIGRARRALI